MRVFLETQRLVLRQFTMADVDNLVSLDADPEVMRFITGGTATARSEIEDEVLPAFLSYYERFEGYGFWAAVEKATGEFLGWFHFRPKDAAGPGEAELGYRLRRSAWGNGYATEGSLALIGKGFTEFGVQRVVAEAMAANAASRRVMEKAGLKLVRTFRQPWPHPIAGDELGAVEYALQKADWQTRDLRDYKDGAPVSEEAEMAGWSPDQAYGVFPQIEEEFSLALDESLDPRGPGLLFDLVAGLALPPGAIVIDVGCGEGRHAIELAGRLGMAVTGVDPVPRQIEAARASAGPGGPVFELGSAHHIPAADAAADLVWCRDVLVHVSDLPGAFTEFRRVLRPGGRVLVYQMFGTDRLEPREAAWLWDAIGVAPGSADPACTEAAIGVAGLRIDQCIELGTEWGEWAQEHGGAGGRKLLHASRLLRGRDSYVARHGQAAYDLMLGDCLWHVYAMIGKLTRRVYLLSRPDAT